MKQASISICNQKGGDDYRLPSRESGTRRPGHGMRLSGFRDACCEAGPQKAAFSDGSDQQNAGDGNTQGSPSGDSHGLADFHLRRLIPCRRK